MGSRNLFRVSEAVALALHSVSILAENTERLVSNSELAKQLSASENHLSKVLQRLVRAGIVTSTRGPGGGFKLDKTASETSLLEVYEAIEGSMDVTGCLFDRPVCDGRFCILGNLIQNLERQTRDYLSKTSLDDVAKRHTHSKKRK